MSAAFSFFLRLFLCFAAAKFLLQAIGIQGRGALIVFTLVLLANVYLLSYLVFRDQRWKFSKAAPEAEPAPEAEGPEAGETHPDKASRGGEGREN
jgi:hypothetical protein